MGCRSMFIYFVMIALGFISRANSVAIFRESGSDLQPLSVRVRRSPQGRGHGRGGPPGHGGGPPGHGGGPPGHAGPPGHNKGPPGHGRGPPGGDGPPGQRGRSEQPFENDPPNGGPPNGKPGKGRGRGQGKGPKGNPKQQKGSPSSESTDQPRISEIKYQQYVASIFPEDDTDYSIDFNGRMLARPGEFPHMVCSRIAEMRVKLALS